MKAFDEGLKAKWNAKSSDLTDNVSQVPKGHLISLEDETDEFKKQFNRVISNDEIKASDEYGDWFLTHDNYVNMELAMRRGDEAEMYYARVKRRAVDEGGKPLGTPSNKPLMDQRQYQVE